VLSALTIVCNKRKYSGLNKNVLLLNRNTRHIILAKFPTFEPFIKEDIIQDNPLKRLNKEKAILLKKVKDENYIAEKDQKWLSDSITFESLSSHYLVGRLSIIADTITEEGRKIYQEVKDLVNSMLD
jgi:uncharacterized protein